MGRLVAQEFRPPPAIRTSAGKGIPSPDEHALIASTTFTLQLCPLRLGKPGQTKFIVFYSVFGTALESREPKRTMEIGALSQTRPRSL